MTPDKVRELVQWHMMSYPLCTTENVTRVVLSVLAEARKDARHAALTEAIAVCEPWTTANHIYVNGAIRCHNDILALRDKEQP